MTDAARPPAPGEWRTARLARIVPRTARIRSFFLALDPPLAFHPGQHVDIRLTAPDGYQARRFYSIASAPEATDAIELAIERLDDGEVSGFFHDVAEVGDEIELRGPIGGHFVWSAQAGRPLLAIGGGSGVAPLASMVRHRAAVGSRVPAALLVSARRWDELLLRDQLSALAADGSGLELRFALTREPPRRAGDYGRRVDAAMMAELMALVPAGAEAYLCGSNAFVEAAAQSLIAAGFPARAIRTERFGE